MKFEISFFVSDSNNICNAISMGRKIKGLSLQQMDITLQSVFHRHEVKQEKHIHNRMK